MIDSSATIETMPEDYHQEKIITKPNESLTSEEKRKKITELYNNMLSLQAQLQKAKEKIERIQCNEEIN